MLMNDGRKNAVILRRSPRSGEPRRISHKRDAKTALAAILRDTQQRAPQDNGKDTGPPAITNRV
jgi:hypothetical protein